MEIFEDLNKLTIKKLEPLGNLSGNFATTHRDSDGDKLTLRDLNTLKIGLFRNPFIYNEHDTSHPPLAKVVTMEIKQMKDGEYALFGTAEFYNKDVRSKKGFSTAFV